MPRSYVVAAIFLGLTLFSTDVFRAGHAAPFLRLTLQSVANRTLPPPIPVSDFQGAIPLGYGKLHFIAPGGVLRWDTWSNPHYIAAAQAALRLIEQRAVGNARCNNYFAGMAKGKTFDQIWNGTGPTRIHISFSPGPSGTWRAASSPYSAPFEWTITEPTVKLGPESIASAMLLEATRANSVGPQWQIAFGAEEACGVPAPVLSEGIVHRLGWAYWFEK